MQQRVIEVEGDRWRVISLDREAERVEKDDWHLARVRFEPVDVDHLPPRETWLRVEEDLPADDVLDQYDEAQLQEAFLVAEESPPEEGSDPGS